jgi:hypothetical protein
MYAYAPAGSSTADVGTPFVGGPAALLISARWPLPKSRLKVSITALPCVETTTNPLLEEAYFVLQATTPVKIRVAIPKIQVNLVRMLPFISCERAAALPGKHKPGLYLQ